MNDETARALLDDPVRSALTTEHRGLAMGGPPAWRYPTEVGPFGAVADDATSSFEALAALVRPGDRVALVTVDPLPPPPFLTIQRQAPILQMLREVSPIARETSAPEPFMLGTEDAADMVDLTDRTRPGPFGRRTIACGTYLGIRIAGALAAMAGERMRFGQFVEISAVCVDPRFRGRGYAALLMEQLADRIQAAGLIPFLHVFGDNAGAIALYEKLGYTLRRRLFVNSLTLKH